MVLQIAKFIERHGLPWVVGKASLKASSQEKRAMATDLAREWCRTVAVLSSGVDVAFLDIKETNGHCRKRRAEIYESGFGQHC